MLSGKGSVSKREGQGEVHFQLALGWLALFGRIGCVYIQLQAAVCRIGWHFRLHQI